MAEPINLSKPQRPIHVGVILFNGVTEILDVAPVDMFHCLSKSFLDPLPDDFVSPELKAQAMDFVFHWVTESGPSKPAALTSGIRILPTDSFATCPPLDIVHVGAYLVGYVPSDVELAYARKAHDECSAFLAVCGGVDVPLRIGALQGKTATAPQFMLDMVRKAAPDTNWVEKRWARDGKVWTSGTLLNGQDMMVAFAKETWGKEKGSLITNWTKGGGWPNRDVDFKDEI